MTFGAPIWLWLSAATLIPIAIHLWNNRSGNPILIATFRFLPQDDLSKARSIQLHEVLLLLLRCLIILALSLFLADPQYLSPVETADVIQISEQKSNSTKRLNFSEDETTLSVSSELISQAGWWSLISQMEQDFPAKSYIVNGDFGTHSFGNRQFSLKSEIVWNANESNQTKSFASKSWFGSDGNSYRFVQKREKGNMISEISPHQDSLTSAINILLTVDKSLSPRAKEGVRFVAQKWNIPFQESEIPSAIQVQSNGALLKLKSFTDETNPTKTEWLNPTAFTGIPIEIHTSESADFSEVEDFRLLSQIDATTFAVRGKISPQLEPFVFAGITQFLLQESLEIDEFLSPILPENQRQISVISDSESSNRTRKSSAQSWVLIALILLWMMERLLAPKRNM